MWRVVGGVSVALVLLLASACSTGGEEGTLGVGTEPSPDRAHTPTQTSVQSLEEYFLGLSRVFDRLQEELVASTAPEDPEGPGGPEGLLEYFQNAFVGLEQAVASFMREVEALSPPIEAARAHDAFLEALGSDLESVVQFTAAIREAENIDEVTAAVQAGGPTLANSRAPCKRLQDLASANNINVALPCEE